MLEKARDIWGQDTFRRRAIASEDRDVHEYFGCGLIVCHKVWVLLSKHRLHPVNPPSCENFLWALMFLKVYPKARVMCHLTGVKDYKTIKNKMFPYVRAISSIEGNVVCFFCFYILIYFLLFCN